MSFLWNPPEKVVPYVRGKYNDGHCYDRHGRVNRILSCMVNTLRQNVRDCSVNLRHSYSNDNCAGGHYLYGSSAASITMDNISGSVLGCGYIVHYVLTGTYKRTR